MTPAGRTRLRLFRLEDALAPAKPKRRVQLHPVKAAPSAATVETALAAVGAPPGQRIICPWPPNALSANSRGARFLVSKARRAYRRQCWGLALEARVKVPADGTIRIRLDMFPPDRRANDDDNPQGRFKAGRDGIAEALKVDDSRFRVEPHLHRDQPLACMVVTILGETADAD
ncbi:hypothetical protein [Rhizorhabdus sp.]|uniref:hypothetical protein n=1 Tax=Rhizorhabdus sp. TaxID=1968843 RepID=UPI0019CA40DE|nr:hypothetical protein [Rhizorhabdus sp.]MBD3762624.1 hypothetical protein [Rhizorhabdus sp.]